MQFVIEIERIGQGRVTDEIEIDTPIEDWAYQHIYQVIGKLGYFIQAQGPELPTEVTQHDRINLRRDCADQGQDERNDNQKFVRFDERNEF